MAEELAEKPLRFQLQIMRRAAKRMWRAAVDLLAPPRCLACGESVQEPASLCAACWDKTRLIDDPVCDVMGTPFAYDQGVGTLSPQALSHPPAWDRARAAMLFDEHSKGFVHAFKYGDRAEAGLFMARQMARAGRALLAEAEVVVPVPLHWRRLWARRFNQAAFLAQRLAAGAAKPYVPQALKRQRATPQQVGLDAEQRRKNVRQAFVVPDPRLVKGKRVLLIDDVRTTGATISACCEALKTAGAAKVFVLTFALVNAPFRPHNKKRDG